MRQYWLMKSEPNEYSISDLESEKTTYWDGVRNYQARNFLRDQMKVGDGVFFYHSIVKPVGIAGQAEVVKSAYADFTAWDPEDKHFDPRSTPEKPLWVMVDIRFVKACKTIITLDRIREIPALNQMGVIRKGNRLSVQPVSPEEWEILLGLPEWEN